MDRWFKIVTFLVCLFTGFLIIKIAPTQAQFFDYVGSNPAPNKILNVVRRAGNCPKNIGFWSISFGYINEIAIGEEIVIADTLPIAGSAKLASERFRFVEYQSPLQPTYATCVGEASSAIKPNSLEARYKFRFQDRKVYFSVDITNIPEGFGGGITEHKVVAQRPFVVLGFAD